MAHESMVTGMISEITAMRALIQNGWEVAKPQVPEVYDLVAKDPHTGKFLKIQVKTARVRDDRDGAIVIIARKGNGQAYTPEEADLIAGVLGDTVYLTEVTGQQEYWSTQTSASKRWVEITAKEAV